MAASNPNPTRISAPLWSLWVRFDAAEPTALLGGLLALKPGYHSYRDRLPAVDYSAGRDVAADKLGSGKLAAAFDFTMSTAAMIKYTKRLDKAARARDPRLYTARGPILREFIGTLDGKTVYCYVLVGGRALGVGADAGPDPGRDSSHLWHLHGSIIRLFADDQAAMDGLLSVLLGESLADWKARTEGGNVSAQDVIKALETVRPYQASGPRGRLKDPNRHPPKGWSDQSPRSILDYLFETALEIRAEQAAARVRDEAILAKLAGDDNAEVLAAVREQGDAIRAEVNARAAEDAARDATMAQLVRDGLDGTVAAHVVLARLKELLPDAPADDPAGPPAAVDAAT